MKQLPKTSSTLIVMFVFSLVVLAQPVVASGNGVSRQHLVHIVLLWLKEPGNSAHRQQFIDATRQFVQIPGVLEVRVGEPLESERDVVDDSFDVGLTVVVKDQQALDNYLNHPIHLRTLKTILRPIAGKIIIYDFEDNP